MSETLPDPLDEIDDKRAISSGFHEAGHFQPPCVAEQDLGALLDQKSWIWKRLTTFAATLLRDAMEGEDVAQETCQRVLITIRSGTTKIHPRAFYRYCHTTAYRLVLNRWKTGRWNGQPEPAESTLDNFDWEASDDDVNGPEMRILLDQALRHLSKNDRTVIELTLMGYQDDEIMKMIATTSANNVRQIRYRAIEKIRKIFDERTEREQLGPRS